MFRYIIEEQSGSYNIVLIDEQHGIKDLIAVVFNKPHANIILRKLNEYKESSRTQIVIDLDEIDD